MQRNFCYTFLSEKNFIEKLPILTERELIQACKKQNRRAQQELYDRYSPKMFGVCRRYIKNAEEAEDVLVEAFFKVLTKLNMYSGEGSFEGWIRRIVVNESLMKLRKNQKLKMNVEINPNLDKPTKLTIEDELAAEDILNLLEQLPTGYRTIFNLYIIEGYKHREIAELLGISINTSKSQLILAKKRMQKLVQGLEIEG
jgi:RNA polymerase sigma-70 factor (ECF subfamily)